MQIGTNSVFYYSKQDQLFEQSVCVEVGMSHRYYKNLVI